MLKEDKEEAATPAEDEALFGSTRLSKAVLQVHNLGKSATAKTIDIFTVDREVTMLVVL